ncbi:glycohydrolase toxin TNT-related protein [Saccharothrix violaceirubra]|uniref:TNT domain-containing protein n=1 Tax=Saccharothrix violaceirubra TaxID=413306 RepID=A0A7W7WTB1_9PSEU|nr:glycohydrolase toxin TNT-related protein [Saccharothrix violaceirubra]MBB4963005.1 hypothetical protein [Saccharothrix violaceirubra]
MSEPKPLNPTEQDALVKQIGLTLMRAAPADWAHVTAEYRATGRYFELSAEVRAADGVVRAWTPPQEVAGLFARLRTGMYRQGRGSWSNARYRLDHPSSYNLDFDRAEPSWQNPPPPQAYVDEMRFFPRTDENVPEWLRHRLSSVPRGHRTARVFDGAGPGGRPSVNRPVVPEPERERLLAYLDGAPVIVAGRGYDADVLADGNPSVVPVAFQTDGQWIWPAAVGYYLRTYGIPPEAELVERARSADFVPPEVSEEARVAAAAHLGAPVAARDTPLPRPPAASVDPGEEVTRSLGEFVPQRIEFDQDGPPYRVTFAEDGTVVDERYRRESYVDGMDLFAPAQYDQDAGDTQAWDPFADDTATPAEQPPADPVPFAETAAFEVGRDYADPVPHDERRVNGHDPLTHTAPFDPLADDEDELADVPTTSAPTEFFEAPAGPDHADEGRSFDDHPDSTPGGADRPPLPEADHPHGFDPRADQGPFDEPAGADTGRVDGVEQHAAFDDHGDQAHGFTDHAAFDDPAADRGRFDGPPTTERAHGFDGPTEAGQALGFADHTTPDRNDGFDRDHGFDRAAGSEAHRADGFQDRPEPGSGFTDHPAPDADRPHGFDTDHGSGTAFDGRPVADGFEVRPESGEDDGFGDPENAHGFDDRDRRYTTDESPVDETGRFDDHPADADHGHPAHPGGFEDHLVSRAEQARRFEEHLEAQAARFDDHPESTVEQTAPIDDRRRFADPDHVPTFADDETGPFDQIRPDSPDPRTHPEQADDRRRPQPFEQHHAEAHPRVFDEPGFASRTDFGHQAPDHDARTPEGTDPTHRTRPDHFAESDHHPTFAPADTTPESGHDTPPDHAAPDHYAAPGHLADPDHRMRPDHGLTADHLAAPADPGRTPDQAPPAYGSDQGLRSRDTGQDPHGQDSGQDPHRHATAQNGRVQHDSGTATPDLHGPGPDQTQVDLSVPPAFRSRSGRGQGTDARVQDGPGIGPDPHRQHGLDTPPSHFTHAGPDRPAQSGHDAPPAHFAQTGPDHPARSGHGVDHLGQAGHRTGPEYQAGQGIGSDHAATHHTGSHPAVDTPPGPDPVVADHLGANSFGVDQAGPTAVGADHTDTDPVVQAAPRDGRPQSDHTTPRPGIPAAPAVPMPAAAPSIPGQSDRRPATDQGRPDTPTAPEPEQARQNQAEEPAEPRQVTPEEEREIAGLRRALDDLGVPHAAYRIGGDPVDRTWLLRVAGRSWEVCRVEAGQVDPVRFDRVEDAASYLIGRLVLAGRRLPRPQYAPQRPPNGFRESRPMPPRPAEQPQQQPVQQQPVQQQTVQVPPPVPQQAQVADNKPAVRTWPINPLTGEPPLTLFRQKKMVELAAGTEIDRFGDGAGNLVYAAGTPFEERSLVPSWISRPYRVYRLRRQVEVLTGVAVPWFEQPGGGTAYLMPKSIDDMLADGILVEVANQEAPTR